MSGRRLPWVLAAVAAAAMIAAVAGLGALVFGLRDDDPPAPGTVDLAHLCEAVDVRPLDALGVTEQRPANRTDREAPIDGQVTHVCAVAVDLAGATESDHDAMVTVAATPFADRAAAERDYRKYKSVAGDVQDVADVGDQAYFRYESMPVADDSVIEASVTVQRGRQGMSVKVSAVRDGGWNPRDARDALVRVMRTILTRLPA